MSIADKITRLQNARTAIANAITAKGGTVQSGDGFEDFSTDIATIPSGITPSGNINITDTQSTDVTQYATAQVVDADLVAGNIKKDVEILGVTGTYEGGGGVAFTASQVRSANYMFGQVNSSGGWQTLWTFDEEIIVPKMENCVYAERMFVGNQNTKKIVLGGFCHNGVNMYEFFRQCRTVGGIEIELIEDIYPTTMCSFGNEWMCGSYGNPGRFSGAGRFNCSLCTNMNIGSLNYCGHIEFVENTIMVNFTSQIGGRDYIDNDSLVSIGNGLNESVTSKTINVASEAKTRMQSLMGTVALDPTSTFHVFTADPSGTVTLADFITSTKGWTLA